MTALPVASTEPTVTISQHVDVSCGFRILFCDTCNQHVTHALTTSGDFCVCGMCETAIRYIVNTAKPGQAIDLRESGDARERFANWCEDL